MKTTLLSILTLMLFAEATAQIPKEKTLLWKIEGNSINQPSYLFGTFHMLCSNDFEMPDTIKSLMGMCKQLFLEIDIDDPQMTTTMMKHIKMKDGKRLKDFLTQEEYDTATVLFKKVVGMNLKMVETYKPFMLTSMLYPKMMGCNIIAFEKELAKLAKNNDYETKGLETIEDQLAVFDDVSYKIQAKMFLKSLLEIEEGKTQIQKIVTLYNSKNIRAMQR
ncbi:MAG TPA: TraB/GumN family protein [Chitinophagaceae bacterium]|nr:TraB/GumN family protein [Chitinophagaceae bacterium]